MTYAKLHKDNPIVQDITVDEEPLSLFNIAEHCGLSQSSGMGISHVTWSDIKAWQGSTGFDGMWLAEAVMTISKHFVSAYYEYNDKPVSLSPLDPRTLELLEMQKDHK